MVRSLGLTPRDARAIVEYNRAVFERFARRIRRLSLKEATRHRGIGHESFLGTLVHILNVQEVWLVYIIQGCDTDAELETLFGDDRRHPTTWAAFDAYAGRVWPAIESSVRALTARDLGRPVKAFWMPGRYTVRDALMQSSIEEAHHLGEIIGALWQKDLSPPDMTWIDVRRSFHARKARGGA